MLIDGQDEKANELLRSSGTTYAVKVAPIGGQCNPLEKRNRKRRIGREELNEAHHRTMNRSLKVTLFNSHKSFILTLIALCGSDRYSETRHETEKDQ